MNIFIFIYHDNLGIVWLKYRCKHTSPAYLISMCGKTVWIRVSKYMWFWFIFLIKEDRSERKWRRISFSRVWCVRAQQIHTVLLCCMSVDNFNGFCGFIYSTLDAHACICMRIWLILIVYYNILLYLLFDVGQIQTRKQIKAKHEYFCDYNRR